MGVTFITFAFPKIKSMSRKGDIDSKSVASRVPMEVYLRLLKNSSSKGMTLSSYLCDFLSKDNFSEGGQTKFVYQDRWHIEPKLVEENETLKSQIRGLKILMGTMEEKHKEDINWWVQQHKDDWKEILELKDRLGYKKKP